MQHLEVSGAVRPLYGSLGVKGISYESARHGLFEWGVYIRILLARLV